MNGEKQGFWERGATDQKAKRTNGYLSVEVNGLVATSGMSANDKYALIWKKQREKKAVDFALFKCGNKGAYLFVCD